MIRTDTAQADATISSCSLATGPKTILSLCDASGSWSQPYVDAGYYVHRVDLKYEPGTTQVTKNVFHLGCDITRMDWPWTWPIDGVLAAPSCTCFCRPGSQHWFKMDFYRETERDMKLWRACLRLATKAAELFGAWWALENPPGRHRDLMPEIGDPSWQFQPWEYGDPWTKQTYIWGTARKPPVTDPVEPEKPRRTPNGKTQGRIAFMSSSAKAEREKTPSGFAKAFFEANP